MYPIYSRLEPETKKFASEIASKYPCDTEHAAKVLSICNFNQAAAEAYIKLKLIYGEFKIQ